MCYSILGHWAKTKQTTKPQFSDAVQVYTYRCSSCLPRRRRKHETIRWPTILHFGPRSLVHGWTRSILQAVSLIRQRACADRLTGFVYVSLGWIDHAERSFVWTDSSGRWLYLYHSRPPFQVIVWFYLVSFRNSARVVNLGIGMSRLMRLTVTWQYS